VTKPQAQPRKEPTPAEKLGAAIRAARVAAGDPYRALEGRCWTKERTIVDWEEGRDVPNSAQWGALKGRYRELNQLEHLWREARYAADRNECEEEQPRVAVVPSSIRNAADAPPPAAPEETALRDAVDLLRDAVPTLSVFRLDIDESGRASVEYKLRRVVVTETAGELTVPAPTRKP
jgi:hypothetical protein